MSSTTYCYVFFLAEEAHANVVPEGGALRDVVGCHAVLVHGHVKVPMGLHHTACRQDGLPGTHTIHQYQNEMHRCLENEQEEDIGQHTRGLHTQVTGQIRLVSLVYRLTQQTPWEQMWWCMKC